GGGVGAARGTARTARRVAARRRRTRQPACVRRQHVRRLLRRGRPRRRAGSRRRLPAAAAAFLAGAAAMTPMRERRLATWLGVMASPMLVAVVVTFTVGMAMLHETAGAVRR